MLQLAESEQVVLAERWWGRERSWYGDGQCVEGKQQPRPSFPHLCSSPSSKCKYQYWSAAVGPFLPLTGEPVENFHHSGSNNIHVSAAAPPKSALLDVLVSAASSG